MESTGDGRARMQFGLRRAQGTKALRNRMARAADLIVFALAGACSLAPGGSAQSPAAKSEQEVWGLEHGYWRYVEQNDLRAYRGLWHENFLGWPSVSAAPVGKDHITDWITSQTGKGLAFRQVAMKPAAIQVTGNVAMTFYWETFRWVDAGGAGAPIALRVSHTWVRDKKGWKILGGMSMPEAAAAPE